MAASVPGFGQTPPRMFSMPPRAPGQTLPSVPSAMGHLSLAGSRVSMSQKINPNQVPRPLPSSSIIYYETRQGNQANFPPVDTHLLSLLVKHMSTFVLFSSHLLTRSPIFVNAFPQMISDFSDCSLPIAILLLMTLVIAVLV